jgi:hypothetical protein
MRSIAPFSRKLSLLASWLLLATILGCQENSPVAKSDSDSAPAVTPQPPAPSNESPPTTTPDPSTPQAAANNTNEPPPEAIIKSKLEKDMWGPPEQGGTVHTYDYKSLKIAAGRQGNYLTDGVPANKETVVYPVKVQVQILRKFTDGSTAQEEKNQTYVFFKDEFGDWTYRFIQNN